MKNFYRILNNMDKEVILTEYDFSFMYKDNTVYQLFKGDELLYVGITTNIHKRLNSHKNKKSWFCEVDEIYISEPLTRNEAHIYEIYFISKFNPKYNNHFVNGSACNFEISPVRFLKYNYT